MTDTAIAHRAPPKAVNVLQAVVNIIVLLLFLLLVVSSYRHFVGSGTFRSFGVLAVNTLFVGLYLARRPARSETTSPALWLLAIAGSGVTLLMRPSDAVGFNQVGGAVQMVGLALLAVALLSLRRSFAIVPANRGVRDGGLYRAVRHPIYISELIVLFGVVLANPTALNAAIWVCECALQFARACAEERFLSADPAYRAYCERVRYRLIPGVI